MNFLVISLCILGLTYAWEEDDRCLTRRHLLEHQQHQETLFDIEDLSDEGRAVHNGSEEYEDARLSTERELVVQGAGLKFNLKLYWEKGYCWQAEWKERKWCMECAGNTCDEDDILEIQVCEDTKRQEFTWVPAEGGGRLKVSNKNLCLQRMSPNFFKLKTCSATIKQILVGFITDGPFELHPYEDENKCLNQHHHPKPFEEIYTTSCALARLYKTNQFEATWVDSSAASSNAGMSSLTNSSVLRSRLPECSRGDNCEECEGDCDSDNQCKGNLKCYHRRGRNPWDEIPGCSGRGAKRRDYCYDPANEFGSSASGNAVNPPLPSPSGSTANAVSFSTANSTVSAAGGGTASSSGDIPLVKPVRSCSRQNQCNECEGDCDDNSHCKGNLACFQKDVGYLPIPGCSGRDSSKTDWCIDPSKFTGS
jgi:hypothetical protein